MFVQAEQKAVVKKLKEESVRKLAALGDQYEASIAEMLQQQNVRSYLLLFFFLTCAVVNWCVYLLKHFSFHISEKKK